MMFDVAHPSRARHADGWDAMQERKGVCRDYAHLAVALCRCMNIPARYCTGYLTALGAEPPYGPMDFAAWFEAYIGGRWHTFDARNNTPRIGRVLMARGRDATVAGWRTRLRVQRWESGRLRRCSASHCSLTDPSDESFGP
jgi:transglutaminase-like putative cysteine protease